MYRPDSETVSLDRSLNANVLRPSLYQIRDRVTHDNVAGIRGKTAIIKTICAS